MISNGHFTYMLYLHTLQLHEAKLFKGMSGELMRRAGTFDSVNLG